jgi:hypothetical protein
LPKKTIKAAGGRIEIEFAATVKITGKASVDNVNATKVDEAGLVKAAQHLATDWYDKKAAPQIDGPLFSKLDVKRDGLSLAASSFTRTSVGTFTLKLTIAKIDKDLLKLVTQGSAKVELKVLAASVEYVGLPTNLPDTELWGLKLTSLVAAPTASVEVQPDYFGMLAKWAKDEGWDLLKKMAEDTAIDVGIDIVISGALIVGGVATITAAIYEIVMAWGIADLSQSYKPSIDSAHAGFKAAMAGSQAPGDNYGQAGYNTGKKNHDALTDSLRKQHPDAADDAIRSAIAAKADEALGQASGAIEDGVRRGLWNGYLAQHTTMLGANDARYAFIACFNGLDPKFDRLGAYAGEWQKYISAHPTMAKFL